MRVLHAHVHVHSEQFEADSHQVDVACKVLNAVSRWADYRVEKPIIGSLGRDP
jgi:hypothetical protein